MKIRLQSYTPENFTALDNSAIIYAPGEARYNNNTFRLSFDFTFTIDREALLSSVREILEEFPYLRTRLVSGFFWYYLYPNDREFELTEEIDYPCARFDTRETNGYLFRILYTDHRIAIEVFHALTDGTGGLMILKAICNRYMEKKGISGRFQGALDESCGTEDLFKKYYTKNVGYPGKIPKSFHIKAHEKLADRINVISGTVDISQMKAKAREYGTTITTLIASCLLSAYQQVQERYQKKISKRRIITISVPINLRRIFGDDTLRNFTLFSLASIEQKYGKLDFDMIVRDTDYQLRKMQDRRMIESFIRRNVEGERNLLLRMTPNFLKKPVMALLSDTLGDVQFCTTLSNMGVLDKDCIHLSDADFFLSPGKMNMKAVGVSSIKDHMNINFTSYLEKDAEIERLFFTQLVKMGIHVKMRSNLEETCTATDAE